ncbi:MAG: T3SS effector HopA1 family protein, partial [Burkholderiaceae bacterium]
DAGVVYLLDPDLAHARDLVAAVYEEVSPHLNAMTPALTRRLAPGLGLAEDPGGGESFGQHRCRVVAEGLWNAYAEQASTREARLACVVAQFERHGLSLRRPHLNAGSTLEDD